jgi:hypothetical protein
VSNIDQTLKHHRLRLGGMSDLDQQIETAVRQVSDQRDLIAKRRIAGIPTAGADRLLLAMLDHLRELRVALATR